MLRNSLIHKTSDPEKLLYFSDVHLYSFSLASSVSSVIYLFSHVSRHTCLSLLTCPSSVLFLLFHVFPCLFVSSYDLSVCLSFQLSLNADDNDDSSTQHHCAENTYPSCLSAPAAVRRVVSCRVSCVVCRVSCVVCIVSCVFCVVCLVLCVVCCVLCVVCCVSLCFRVYFQNAPVF